MVDYLSDAEMEALVAKYTYKKEGPRCDRPPEGWKCNGHKDHEGACAAWPDGLWQRVKHAFINKSASYLFARHV